MSSTSWWWSTEDRPFLLGRKHWRFTMVFVVALFIELWNTRSTATPLQGDWVLAMTTYNRIAAELTDVTGQGETIRIVLDDGLPHQAGD
ncbi:hypothetical protein [Streptomyces thermolineatus]|uniref:hypothetical protein n=1 Tax=Streptomyces thermolineatus TaxID=44033 RepID=UPI0031DB37B4